MDTTFLPSCSDRILIPLLAYFDLISLRSFVDFTLTRFLFSWILLPIRHLKGDLQGSDASPEHRPIFPFSGFFSRSVKFSSFLLLFLQEYVMIKENPYEEIFP